MRQEQNAESAEAPHEIEDKPDQDRLAQRQQKLNAEKDNLDELKKHLMQEKLNS
ncbi:MAG UNVERIFIED_CONTAM: hypothetical protein LVQ98_03440 [Rickettsiaceae bacterium]